VLRSLRHLKQVMPGLGLRFSSLVVAAAAGANHQIDMAPFLAEGCVEAENGNLEVLKSPVGEESWCQDFCTKQAAKQAKALQQLGSMDDPQVAYYLLRWSCNASRMTYMARTTPASACSNGLRMFDQETEAAFRNVCGLPLTQQQWVQATFRVKEGGLGLRSSASLADAAYLGSRTATHEACQAVRSAHSWNVDVLGSPIAAAVGRCNDKLAAVGLATRVRGETPGMTQRQVSRVLNLALVRAWQAVASPDDACNLNAYSAPQAGKALGITPSKTLDKHLSRNEFVTQVAAQLGVDVCEGGHACKFCGLPEDSRGRHALSCMSGGDTVVEHNEVRDLVHDYCKRGLLRPELEAQGVLRDTPTPDGRRRPADVLVCSGAALVPRLPDGSCALGPTRVALDFAVINALGPGHWNETFRKSGSAAEAYANKKRLYLDTAIKCEAAGVRFQPMVFEAQGGMTSEAGAILHAIAGAVAAAEDADQIKIREEIFEKISLLTMRANARRIRRRRVGRGSVEASTSSAARAVLQAQLLEVIAAED
jgi:ribosomal protein S9